MEEKSDLRSYTLIYLHPVAKELASYLEGSAREGFLEKINKYYCSDPRSLSGLVIGNLRLLIMENINLKKRVARAEARLSLILNTQGDFFKKSSS